MTPSHQNALSPVTLKVAGLTIEGFSISGVATWVVVPELDVMFDAGECPLSAVPISNVFLSHVHGDHSRCLLRHWQLRRMLDQGEAAYFVPASAVEGFRTLVRTEAEMEGVADDVVFPDFRVLPEGDKVAFKKGVWVRAFPVEHRVQSQGFTVGRTVQKLKPEFAHLPGAEIGALRKAGTVVSDSLDTALVTFIGDCTGASLRANGHIFDSKVVIVEATYVEPGDRANADRHGHTHLEDVVEALRAAGPAPSCEAVVLKHFSLKHHPDRVRERVAELVPAEWADRVKVFLP